MIWKAQILYWFRTGRFHCRHQIRHLLKQPSLNLLIKTKYTGYISKLSDLLDGMFENWGQTRFYGQSWRIIDYHTTFNASHSCRVDPYQSCEIKLVVIALIWTRSYKNFLEWRCYSTLKIKEFDWLRKVMWHFQAIWLAETQRSVSMLLLFFVSSGPGLVSPVSLKLWQQAALEGTEVKPAPVLRQTWSEFISHLVMSFCSLLLLFCLHSSEANAQCWILLCR